MKKAIQFIFLFTLITTYGAFAQPYSSFELARELPANTPIDGNVCNTNDYYFKTQTPDNGTLAIGVNATNSGPSGNGYLYVYVYDGRKFSGTLTAGYIGSSSISPGNTTTDTLRITGLLADSVFIRVTTNRCFDFTIGYAMEQVPAIDVEPNNTIGEATPFAVSDTKSGNIEYRKNGVSDANDYYYTVLPDNGTLNIALSGKNQSNRNGYIYMYGYDRRKLSGQIVAGYVDGKTSVQPDAEVIGTFTLKGRAKDTVYFRITASQSFEYNLSYSITDIPVSDPEPNDDFMTAVQMASQETQQGIIGYYKNGTEDQSDYYATKLPADGAIKLYVTGKNTDSKNGYMYIYGYDKRKASGQLFAVYAGKKSSFAPGAEIKDTITVYGQLIDSFYFRIISSAAFTYSISYDISQEEQSEDEEPNNTYEDANELLPGFGGIGRIGYTAGGVTDDNDYFKAQLPAIGTLRVIVEGTNKGNANGYMYLYIYDNRKASGPLAAGYVFSSSVTPETTVRDTFYVTGRLDELHYLRMTSSRSFNYTIQYDVVNAPAVDAEQNNTVATALSIAENEVKEGNIGYFASGVEDLSDYYRLELAQNSTLKLIIKGVNNGNANGYIYTYVYDSRGLSGSLFAGYVKGTSNPPGTTVTDTVYVSCRAIDSFYHRIASTSAWQYEWQYDIISSTTPEADENGGITQASPLPIGTTVTENIGYLSAGVDDANDYFVTAVPSKGTLGYIIKARNTSFGNAYLYGYIYEKRNTNAQVAAKYLGGSSSLPANTYFEDTLRFDCATFDTLYLRLISTGCWSYEVTPYFIDRQPVADFTSIKRSGLFEFSNLSKNGGKYRWDLGDNTLSALEGPELKSYGAGTYDIQLIVENAFCVFRDTASTSLVVQGLDRYAPNSSGPGNIEFTAYGGGFLPGTRVSIIGQGETFTDTISNVSDRGNQLSAFIDLHDAPPGIYNVEIATGDTTYEIPEGYTIQPGIDKLKIEIIGSDILRANRATVYKVRVNNEGNTMAGLVEVYALFPNYMEVEFMDSVYSIYDAGDPDETIDTLKIFRPVTKSMGYAINGNLYGLYIAGIPPGGYRDLSFRVKSGVGTDPIQAWVSGPASGSGYKGWFDPCNGAKVKLVFDLLADGISAIPIADCAVSAVRAAGSFLYSGVSYLLGNGPPPAAGIAKTVGGVTKNCAGEALLAAGVAPGVVVEVVDILSDLAILGSNLDLNYALLKDACAEEPKEEKEKKVDVRTSWDPNTKSGPAGYGTQRFINGVDKIANYTIFFENLDSATLPAQVVTIVDTLDKSVFDLSTFRAIGYTIAEKEYLLPMDAIDFVNDVSWDDDLSVRFSVEIDTATGVVTVQFKTIDKLTGVEPENPLLGFLPPNLSSPEGEGSFSFAVNMKDDLPDGTVLANKASIIFDENEAIITPVWSNTIDRNRPNSQVLELTHVSDTSAFIHLQGVDPSSGVRLYEIYLSENGGPYSLLGFTRNDSILFTGFRNTIYRFYSRATDKVGNIEIKTPQEEASITFSTPVPVTITSFTGASVPSGNELNWITATEINNRGFYVERSSDGREFTTLEFVPTKAANGNSNASITYRFLDKSPTAKSYYRLRQVDFDGSQKYSSTILLERKASFNIVIAPNPAVNHFRVTSDKRIEGLRLIDMQGRTVKAFIPNNGGVYQLGQTPPGMYILQLNIEGQMHSQRISVIQ